MTLDKFFLINSFEKEKLSRFAEIVSNDGVKTDRKIPVKIAVIYPAIQRSDYWRFSVRSMEKRLEELGVNYEILRYFSKPSGDSRLQVSQIADAIKKKADYIAVSVDNQNIKRHISSILIKGKPKVFIQNLTTPLTHWLDNPPLMYVGFDHIEGAKKIADHYVKHFSNGAKYLMLYGSKGTVSKLRGEGFESYSSTKGFTPVAKFYTDFDSEKAYQATINTLKKHSDISFIYACSTDIAAGAARALKEKGLSQKIMLNGWGGTELELDLIKKKELDFTVMRINDDNGIAIAEAVKFDIEDRSKAVPAVFSGEFVTVSKEMANEEIEKLRKKAFRYSGR
jgi:autoinducer 2-binding protein LuxP